MTILARSKFGHKLRRFLDHKPPGRPYVLSPDHAAARGSHTLFGARVVWPGFSDRLLKSAHHNRKIGSPVIRGAWAGMPVYTLTLEERATCPPSCTEWRSCYGNKMNRSERLVEGKALEWRLGRELWLLAARHPDGFIVRLHVLGDFYSRAYVRRWLSWLRRLPQLHVYGYSAWQPDTPIGSLVRGAALRMWGRFAVRTSGASSAPRALIVDVPLVGPIVCPAQTARTECCATCGLCWGTTRDIQFLRH